MSIRTNSTATIARINSACNALIADYRRDPDGMPAVTLSVGNRKIGKTMNISTAPVFTCARCGMCAECSEICYAVHACARLGLNDPARNAWIRNTAILFVAPDKFFADITAEIRRQDPAFFRWHVSGEIIDSWYFGQAVKIAEMFPGTRFLIYTKAYSAVNDWLDLNGGADAIPHNLSVLFSAWRGNDMPNPYKLAECHVAFNDGAAETFADVPASHVWKCGGDCSECQAVCGGCWFRRPGSVYADGIQDITVIKAH